jgi:hypothetical protein
MKISLRFFLICLAMMAGIILYLSFVNRHLQTRLEEEISKPPVTHELKPDSVFVPADTLIKYHTVTVVKNVFDTVSIVVPETVMVADSCHSIIFLKDKPGKDPIDSLRVSVPCPNGNGSEFTYYYGKLSKINTAAHVNLDLGGGFLLDKPFVCAGLGFRRFGLYVTSNDGRHYGGMVIYHTPIF